MATPAKRALDFDQINDKSIEAIKEVKEVTPVEDKAAKASAPNDQPVQANPVKKANNEKVKPVNKRPVTAPVNTSSRASRMTSKTSEVVKKSSSKDSLTSSVMTKSTSSTESTGSSSSSKVKKERVSLVERQTRFATSVTKKEHRVLTRSATIPSMPGRGRSVSNPKPNKPKIETQKSEDEENKQVNIQSWVPAPFGSTSSISSSSSNRSWADTVKGLKTPKSVENIKTYVKDNDQDDGWEMVKSRTRSNKHSPKVGKVIQTGAPKARTPLRATKSAPGPKNLGSRGQPKVVLEKVVESKEKSNSAENISEINDDSEIVKKDEAIALAEKEEENLAREIRETESEMPPDDLVESSSEAGSESVKSLTPSKLNKMFEGLSWADQIDLEEQLLESRYPGRAIQLHEKLSSPARKKEPQEAFKAHQEKQKNAKIRRLKFQDEKATKLSALNLRIEEVIAYKESLICERKDLMRNKMAKAEAKRQEHIEGIRKKAREEDAKLKEIGNVQFFLH